MNYFVGARNGCAIGLMAKAPIAGEVKTRLVPPLTPREAATLNMCFLRDMAANIDGVTASGAATSFVVYTPAGSQSAFAEGVSNGFKFLAQRGESLGERLCNATDDLLNRGFTSVCLLNSDSPTLPRSIVSRAIELLAHDGERAVFGPAEDGGYYLIGLKRPHPNLFDRIPWSTPDVLALTMERASEISLPVELLPPWYDVDDAETLHRLCEELFSAPSQNGAYPAPHTRVFLEGILKEEGSERIWPSLNS
jgi:rSAM/selenodomain-associated transferase 1